MQKESYYDNEFYTRRKGPINTSKFLIPLLNKIVKPKSVVDVGCGSGEFLQAFKKSGVKKVLGIDGTWVKQENLHIKPQEFLPKDLEKPLRLQEKYDLVMSLEVAEHISRKNAEQFIQSLTQLGDIILFSAAIPNQGGVHHLNEQWQEYWMKIFEKKGYVLIDAIRPVLWSNPQISVWYAQNTFLYVKKTTLSKNKKLKELQERTNYGMINLVHPGVFTPAGDLYLKINNLFPKPIRKFLAKIKSKL